ncbi:MAG TPA: hypothetical protein VMB21_10660, partial [Candidatus Limnocylindria bacterium]|nr:hypothetical protein [Candidatus Limnocylindria bacterium]
PPAWSKTRWFTAVFVTVMVLAALVTGLTHWPSLPQPVRTQNVHVRLFNGPLAAMTNAETLLPDPLLFVQGDPHGFSGSAAHSLPRSDYEVAVFSEAPRWLPLDPTARRTGAVPGRPPPAAYRLPPTTLPALAGEAIAPLLDPASQAILRGRLARRPLTEPLSPPLIKSADVLQSSVIEVGVTDAGDVLMARLVSSSGLSMADDLALELALHAHFAPVDGDRRDPGITASEPEWGEIGFVWRLEP